MDVPKIGSLFDSIDHDQDGHISRTELRAALKALRIPYSTGALERFIRGCDSDDNDSISKSEFIGFVLIRREALENAFRRLDISDDGRISASDIRTAAESMSIALSDSEVQHLIRVADTDGDGLIDMDEFVDMLLLVGDTHIEGLFDHWLRHDGASLDGDSAVDPPKGGVAGFWRGNGTNVLKIAPETAVRFFAFDYIKRQIASNPGNVTAAERFVAGAIAGVISTCAIYPLEIAKTRLALSQSGQFKGIADCLVSLARTQGLPAVYRGLGASLLGIVPYSGTELMTFSLLRDAYAARFPDTEPGVATLLSCGAVASMAGQVVAFPLQLARTRLQAQGLPGREGVKYSGVVHCLSSVLKRDGPLGLYRGMLPGFLKSIPSCMISFAVFEQTRSFLNKIHKPPSHRA